MTIGLRCRRGVVGGLVVGLMRWTMLILMRLHHRWIEVLSNVSRKEKVLVSLAWLD